MNKTLPKSEQENAPAGLLALHGRLHRNSGRRLAGPALAEELASALALAELASSMEATTRLSLLRLAAQRFHAISDDQAAAGVC